MVIRFKVNQKESLLRGVDAEPIQTLDVDPSGLPEHHRKLIFKYALQTDDGLDIVYDPAHATDESWVVPVGQHSPNELVQTKGPNLDDVLESLQELESALNKIQEVNFSAQPADGERLKPGINP